MPIRLPEKVSISPKAMSTLWWISPTGGEQNPAMSIAHPKVQSAIEVASCIFLILYEKGCVGFAEVTTVQ